MCLKRTRNRYVSVIYDDLLKKKSIKEIHKDIKKTTLIVKKQGYVVSKNLQNYMLDVSKKVKLELDGVLPIIAVPIEEWIFKKIEKLKVYYKTNEIVYDFGKRIESDLKQEIIKNELKQNRTLDTPKIFYLASTHNDSAVDHKDYQGKIYVDANWKSFIKDERVNEYISRNNVNTFQWVTNRPVWFVTRPNCRHYFKAVDTEEVLSSSVSYLISKYNMKSVIGHRVTQTIKHPLVKSWYTVENVENIIEKYRDRLAYHNSLLEVNKNSIIDNSIKKDEFLIKKWTKFKNNMI